jgi:alpha-L-fucosidase 2
MASSQNANPFYYVEKTPDAVVSPKATITPPQIGETVLYDIATKPGQVINLVMQ